MAACSFALPFEGSQDVLFDIVQQAVKQNGGAISGSKAFGNITLPTPAGQVTGTYRTVPGRINVEITDKPFLVSCARIESELRKGLLVAAAKAAKPAPSTATARSSPTPAPASDDEEEPAGAIYYDFAEGETVTVSRPQRRRIWPFLLGTVVVGAGVWTYSRKRAR